MSEELKPCPGCKSTDVRTDRDGQEFPLSLVWCHECGLCVDDSTACLREDETPFDRWQSFPRTPEYVAEAGADREAIAVELAGHFALRPWAEMASDRQHLRQRVRNDRSFEVNEATQDDCRAAADAILSLFSKQGEGDRD